MLTKKYLFHLFNLILVAALGFSSQGSVFAQSPTQAVGGEFTPPLFSGLDWKSLGVVQKDLQVQGQSLALSGEAFEAVASFTDKNPESLFEYYSSENLESLGWLFVGGVDVELVYKNKLDVYLTVEITQCSTDGVGYCVNVWLGSDLARGLTSPTIVAFNKTTPSNGATIAMPTTTYQLLRWTDAQIPTTDRYQYCIDEINNNNCDTTWLTRNSLYSGGPSDFAIVPGHTYYWQVKTRDAGTFANGGTWWSFTISTVSFNKTSPSNGAIMSPPATTYMLLQWSDAQIASTDRYQYCIDETNNSLCEGNNWITRDSLYSGGPGDFPVLTGHTYYWQVRVRDLGVYANSGAWSSFTVQNYPLVASIVRGNPSGSTTSAATVEYTVLFNQSVTGVDLSDFTLTTTGVSGASVSGILGSTGVFTVTVTTGNGNGTIRLNVIDNDTIQNGASNPLGGPGAGNGNFTTGEVYTITRPVTFTSAASEDGWILESGETTTTGGTMNSANSILAIGDNASNRQYRSILSFDTSSLPDTAVITAATLKFKYAGTIGTLPFSTHGNLLADVRKGPFNSSSSLQLNDFKAGASLNAVLSYINNAVDNWYSNSFASANFQYVNLAGVTQFRLRFATDDNNDLGADFLKIYSGNTATAADRPQLIIEYHLP